MIQNYVVYLNIILESNYVIEIIVDCIMALGALATAATFILVLRNQKGTQQQINSLSQMAEMYSRHYQLERI